MFMPSRRRYCCKTHAGVAKIGKTREWLLGRTRAAVAKRKHDEAMMGHPTSKETRRKISQSLMGHPVSEETIRKMLATREYATGADHHMWKGGVAYLYPNEFYRIRDIVREEAERRCEACGKAEKDNGRRLDVHHRDGNKYNNARDNLVALCGECHTEAHR